MRKKAENLTSALGSGDQPLPVEFRIWGGRMLQLPMDSLRNMPPMSVPLPLALLGLRGPRHHINTLISAKALHICIGWKQIFWTNWRLHKVFMFSDIHRLIQNTKQAKTQRIFYLLHDPSLRLPYSTCPATEVYAYIFTNMIISSLGLM